MAGPGECGGAWLALAGAGLHPGHVTRELERLASCASIVVVDTYTMPGADWLVLEMERLAPGRVVAAGRSLLEEGARSLAERALRERVLVVAPGDPLIATTHRSLLSEARRLGARAFAVPGVSGVCAAKSLSGLDYYRFGRTVTVPGPWRGVGEPVSTYYYTVLNMCWRMHTLLLLDIEPGGGGQLSICGAEEALLRVDERLGPALRGHPVILVERAGMPGQRIRVSRLGELCLLGRQREPASIVVPGPTMPYEEEAVEAVAGSGLSVAPTAARRACIAAEKAGAEI